MPRFAFRIEYDGAPFRGWQLQDGQPSVQGAFEAALARLDASAPRLHAAGRTDTGVHATGQVAHADLTRDWAPERLMMALNHHLRPKPVAVNACACVDTAFHARFSAIERRYTYRLVSRRAPLVHARGQVWQLRHALDADAMREGARALIGRHDFTTFRASLCQAASPVKTLAALEIEVHPVAGGGCEYRFDLRARSFLHNQVRSIVGTLERVGAGAWAPARVCQALAARAREACGPVAPPQGLFLTGVGYPNDPFAA